MARGQLAEVVRQLRRAALLSDRATALTDGQLLECFLTAHDEAAFEALVRRHGPMVLGVCRRVLRNEQDAEDAFQATFLVLIRKASSILPRDRVGNWLYGVAYRTALKAKSMNAKRRAKERQLAGAPRPDVDERGQELLVLLDSEVNRLPPKYRQPVVLCDLEGMTRQQAAHQLGWPEGTVATRLATARRMLAKRLTRHGLQLAGGSLAVGLWQNASASVSVRLVHSTVQVAMVFAIGQATATNLVSVRVATLTAAVLKGMFMSKVKFGMAVSLVCSLIGLGLGAGSYRLAAGEEKADGKTRVAGTENPPAQDETKVNGRLPANASSLMQAFVRLNGDGRLAVTKVVRLMTSTQEETSDGGRIISEYRNRLSTDCWDLAEVEILDNTGMSIDKEQLPKLLHGEVLALIYMGPDKFDPLHLRVIKDGVLVFLLPSHATPVPAVSPPSAPRPRPFGQAAPSAAQVGKIVIVGNEKTSTEVILKAIPFFPGQPLKHEDLRKAEEAVQRLPSIEKATVRIIESTGAFKDVLVTVKEK
jgi:RNA polymerase sigma factor (sigma-70 family)